MPAFSTKSIERLETCNKLLRDIAYEVIKKVDCTVVTGFRNQVDQDNLYPRYTRVKWPDSKHNQFPSMAIDLVPYIPGKGISYDTRQAYWFSGYVKRVADEMGIKIRSGADWDQDGDVNDQSFHDPCHFELVE